MENSVEALKMAFAVLVFGMALTITITSFSKTRETADYILSRSDPTTYYSYEEYVKNGNDSENRIVGMETIIPTIYKYIKEDYRIVFKDGEAGLNDIKSNIANPSHEWRNLDIYRSSVDGKTISTFDLLNEQSSGEHWTINQDEIKKHIDSVVSGTDYKDPSNNKIILPYLNGLKNYNNRQFVECVGRVEEDTSNISTVTNKTTTKTVVTYILIR